MGCRRSVNQCPMSRQKEHRSDDCHADENYHRENALEQRRWDRRQRSGLSLGRYGRVEHSDAGDFSWRNAASRGRSLRFRLVLAVSEFVRHSAHATPIPGTTSSTANCTDNKQRLTDRKSAKGNVAVSHCASPSAKESASLTSSFMRHFKGASRLRGDRQKLSRRKPKITKP
jgi:hypothetical protein